MSGKSMLMAVSAVVVLSVGAAVPQVPKGTAAAVYVNCGPISKNADAQKMWTAVVEESHCMTELSNGFRMMRKDEDVTNLLASAMWKEASFDWALIAFEKLDFREVEGKIRVPRISCAVYGAFNAEEFLTFDIEKEIAKKKAEEIVGLGYKAYQYKLDDEDAKAVTNVNACMGSVDEGLLVIGSNKKAMTKVADLYKEKKGSVAESGLGKVFAKSKKGLLSGFVNVDAVDKDALLKCLELTDPIEKAGVEVLMTLISRVDFYVDIVTATEVKITLDIVERSSKNKSLSLADILSSVRQEAAARRGSGVKSVNVSSKGNVHRFECVMDAVALAKILDEGACDGGAAEADGDDDDE